MKKRNIIIIIALIITTIIGTFGITTHFLDKGSIIEHYNDDFICLYGCPTSKKLKRKNKSIFKRKEY